MALEGFLQEFGLADILQLIYFQRKTGVLKIEARLDSIELSFIKGNISGLRSKRRSESNRIGKILVKKGLINQKDLDTAIEMQKTERVKLGNIFIRHNLITKEALEEIIKAQIIETIVQIFTWKEGRYEFVPQEIPVDKEAPIYLDTQHLLMDGLRIVDEWSLVEGKLDLNTIYKQIGEPEPDELSDIEKEVLGLVDDDSDAITITNTSSFGDFETSKAIISLEEKGIIEPIEIKPLGSEEEMARKDIGYPLIAVFLFSVVVILIFALKGNLETLKAFKNTRANFSIEKLRSEIEIYNVTNGRYPENFEIVSKEKDQWGRAYIFRLKEKGFTLFSPGSDGVEGTDDDVY